MRLNQILAFRDLEAAKPLLIFDPKQALSGDISKASSKIGKYLSKIKKPSDIHKSSLESPLASLIKTSEVNGFMMASHYTQKLPTVKWSDRVLNSANARASEVDGIVKAATSKGLKSGDAYWLSSARAEKIANYEATKAFYSGVLANFKDSNYTKEWILNEAHGEDDDCDDADDDGPIDVDEDFSNGYDAPPSHLNCQCTLGFRQTK